ncbi:putative amidophosphoribosyltransferase [Isoptericola variabilis J7]|uniref:ComF family protein n=1 Tax=Isoptericola variabilis TaxID=139208 RepID=UPI0011ACFF9B|nr:phosphoribosyltransferase family protein [Isoptericola variabilis]TWH26199.1 putative amidophosphoribosyltransferase [Isoptericola variabilis J7]
MVSAWRRWARELARLVVPVACAGCGLPDVPCCARCAALLDGAPRRVEAGAPRLDRLDGVAPLPVWALVAYAGPVRDLVVAWKDRGRVDLDRLLAAGMRRAAAVAPGVAAAAPGGVLVVPAPSSAAARRARGREHVRVLARAVARGLSDAGVPAAVAPVLRRRGGARDQVGLGSRARGRNLAAAVAVRRRALLRAGGRGPAVCLLVDDVLTTGATLAAAERALETAGAAVVGALVAAATPPPGTRSSRDATDLAATVYRPGGVGLA